MKLPSATATQSIAPSVAAGRRRDAAIAPMIDLSCILTCGAAALGCVFCLTNPVCWIACAGPAAYSCIKACL